MAYNHEYPYVDPNRYNADWILNKMKELEGEMSTFEALNKITFDGEWDITKQYPAWCIVNWNNGQEGYISLKPVPAGVTIDNTEYRTSVVNYTATIADLQNRVVALENADVAIDARLDRLENRKFVFIGDSYAENYTSGGVDYIGWVDNLISQQGLTSDNIKPYDIYRVSGTGFCAPNYTMAWKVWIDSKTLNPDITDVVICGGDNDIRFGLETATLTDCIVQTLTSAKTKWPNARIWVGYIAFDLSPNVDNKYVASYKIYNEVCSQNGCIIMDGLANAFADRTLMRGLSHPNNAGTKILAGAIGTALKGGTFSFEVPMKQATLNMNDGVSVGTYIDDLFFTVTDNILTVDTGLQKNRFAMTFTPRTGYFTNLGTAAAVAVASTTDLPLGESDVVTLYSGGCYAHFTNEGWVEAVCRVLFWHNFIEVVVGYVNSGGWITDELDQVHCPAFRTTINLLAGRYTAP